MADEVAKARGGGVVLPALLITVIAVAGGGAFGSLVLGQVGAKSETGKSAGKHKSATKKYETSKKGAEGKKKETAEHKAASGELSDSEAIIELPTIVTNLDSQSKYWVRLETSIIAKAGTKPISLTTQKRLAQDIMAHMRQSQLSELEGASGLTNLRSDLGEIVRIRTRGRSEELVVHGMVVE